MAFKYDFTEKKFLWGRLEPPPWDPISGLPKPAELGFVKDQDCCCCPCCRIPEGSQQYTCVDEVRKSFCSDTNGVPKCNHTTCQPNTCCNGACCQGTSCTVTADVVCQQLGGTFKGCGTTCASGTCDESLPCCGDYNTFFMNGLPSGGENIPLLTIGQMHHLSFLDTSWSVHSFYCDQNGDVIARIHVSVYTQTYLGDDWFPPYVAAEYTAARYYRFNVSCPCQAIGGTPIALPQDADTSWFPVTGGPAADQFFGDVVGDTIYYWSTLSMGDDTPFEEIDKSAVLFQWDALTVAAACGIDCGSCDGESACNAACVCVPNYYPPNFDFPDGVTIGVRCLFNALP